LHSPADPYFPDKTEINAPSGSGLTIQDSRFDQGFKVLHANYKFLSLAGNRVAHWVIFQLTKADDLLIKENKVEGLALYNVSASLVDIEGEQSDLARDRRVANGFAGLLRERRAYKNR